MKRVVVVLLCVCFLVSMLSGCGAVPNVIEAIDDIGEITPDSGKVLSEVEAMLDDLSDRELDKVENLDDYEDAVEEYEERKELLEETQRAINAIGPVTMKSGERIRKARKLYNSLKKEDWEDYVADIYPVLSSAEEIYDEYVLVLEEARNAIEAVGEVDLSSSADLQKAWVAWEKVDAAGLTDYFTEETSLLLEKDNQFRELEQQHLYAAVVSSLEEGDVDGAEAVVLELSEKYPQNEDLDELISLVAEEMLKGVQTALNNNQLLNAEKLLGEVLSAFYEYSQNSENYKSLKASLDKKLENNRPANGKVLTDKVGGGYGTMHIEAGSADALIKLEDRNDPEKYKLVFVRANETATFSVSSGEYNLKYATGTQWYGTEDLFGDTTSYTKADDIFEFTVSYEGSYVYYSEITVTLYTVIGGNLSTEPISESQF